MVFDTHTLDPLHELSYDGCRAYMHVLAMVAMSGISSDELFAEDGGGMKERCVKKITKKRKVMWPCENSR